MTNIITHTSAMESANSSITERLAAQRILPSSDIPPHDFLFTWHNIPCFARGELVAVTGKAKSGKTYLNSILMAVAGRESIRPQVGLTVSNSERSNSARGLTATNGGGLLGLSRLQSDPLKVLWLDTEQSEDSTHEILQNRIGMMIGHEPTDDRFFVFNLRQVNWQERFELVKTAILIHEPDLVIFDGIRDIVGDINDYTEAQNVIGQLLSIASFSRACIVCVLHQNKAVEDKTLRGALGTELQNKSFETYECAKDPDTRVFTVRQTATRKFDIPSKQQFILSPEGLPIPFIGEDTDTPSPASNENTKFNPAYLGPDGKFDQPKLFGYILQNGKRMPLAQLRQVVMNVGNIRRFNFAGLLIDEACANGIIALSDYNGTKAYALCEQTIF